MLQKTQANAPFSRNFPIATIAERSSQGLHGACRQTGPATSRQEAWASLIRAARASILRKSRDNTFRAISAIAPAVFTPVGPPRMIANVAVPACPDRPQFRHAKGNEDPSTDL